MNAFIKIFAPVGLFICLAWIAWWAAVEKMTPHKAEQGQIGDLFGGINALFSGLALAGVVTAVVLQSRELQLQRDAMNKQNEELELTRNEIKLQREQLELQREELKLSREEFHRMASANEDAAKALEMQIKLLAATAKIQGVTTLIDCCNSALASEKHPTFQGKFGEFGVKQVRQQYVDRLSVLMREIEARS